MIFTTSKVFIDSSLLIEAEKGNFISFLNNLYFDSSIQLCINDVVLSEYLFHFISLQTGKSPLTIKERKEISKIIEIYNEDSILDKLEFIPSTKEIVSLVPNLMSRYNLLPNDAIILATCLVNKISTLASHDEGFILPCNEEGITLLKP